MKKADRKITIFSIVKQGILSYVSILKETSLFRMHTGN